MSDELLPGINSPADMRQLNREQPEQLAYYLRTRVHASLSQPGRHRPSNLRHVELSIELHY